MKIKDLIDMESTFMWTIWGHPGTGKTSFIRTFPKPILLLDVGENGSASAKFDGLKKGDITVAQIETWNDFDEALEMAEKFKTVVIDGMTGVQNLCHQKIMADENKKKMTQPMYGTATTMLKGLIVDFKSLVDDNVIPVFICHSRTDEIETELDEVIASIGPALTPGAANFLAGCSQIVVQTYIRESSKKVDGKRVETVDYCLRTGPNPYFKTKIQKSVDSPCPDFLINPTYDDVMAIATGTKKDKKKKVKT
jgi:hypothetical protein